jgi:hypothetical protein
MTTGLEKRYSQYGLMIIVSRSKTALLDVTHVEVVKVVTKVL